MAAWARYHPLERPGVLLTGDRFLFPFGMGTGPTDPLPWQERSTYSMNVASVMVQRTMTDSTNVMTLSRLIDVCAVCPGLTVREMLQSREEAAGP